MSDSKITFEMIVLGCQMNRLDAELLESSFRARGWRPSEGGSPDLVLFLTCSVRAKPEDKVFARLSQLRKEGGRPVVCVAGCMAQLRGAAVVERSGAVDLVLGTRELSRAADLLSGILAGGETPVVALGDSGGVPQRDASTLERPFQAYVAAARGCSNRCAYCVVPEARGPAVSRPVEEIVAEAAGLVESGVTEISLVAQSISGFGRDLSPPARLAELLRAVHGIPGLLRLRFLTSHPADMTEETLEALAGLPKVCPHLHMPAQSGSNRILQAMGRGYTRERYLELVATARRLVPGVEFTSDFIVGFPGETEADFEATLSLVEEVRFQNIFVFKYSPRPGTRAALLEDCVAPEEKLRRNHAMLAAQERLSALAQEALVGRTVEVLAEGPSRKTPSRMTGRTTTNRIVHFPFEPGLEGRLLRVKIESATPLSLSGRIVP